LTKKNRKKESRSKRQAWRGCQGFWDIFFDLIKSIDNNKKNIPKPKGLDLYSPLRVGMCEPALLLLFFFWFSAMGVGFSG